MDAGEEKIDDEGLAARLRKQAMGIRARSLLAAVFLALLFYIV